MYVESNATDMSTSTATMTHTRTRARTHTYTYSQTSLHAAFIPIRNDAGQGHHRLYRRSGCSLTAETLVVVEALLTECLVAVLTLTSQGLTMFLSLGFTRPARFTAVKVQPSEL